MSAIWSSSERPISVRTVWVGGIRHVVLSPDDPLINTKNKYRHRRPHTSKGNHQFSQSDYQQLKSPSPSGLDSLNNCFVNLRVMVEKDDRGSSEMIRRQSAPSCGRLLSDDSGRSFKSCSVTKDIKKHLMEDPNVKDFRIEIKSIEERWNNTRNDYSSRSSNVDKLELPEIRSNLLSERVLQWLDLSGKVQNYVQGVQDMGKCLNPEEQRSNRQEIFFSDNRKISRKNYKSDKGQKAECLIRRERRMARRKLFEIDECAKKKNLIEIEENSWVKSMIEKEDDDDLSIIAKKQEEEEEEEEEEDEKKSFTNSWSSVGRPQLHIFMPKLNCNEKIHASSQESLN